MRKNIFSLCGALIFTLSTLFAGGLIAQPQGGMGGPDFSEAAETLGVSEEALMEALGGPPPDFAAAAEKLGLSEEELMEALPAPPEGGRPQQ